MGCACKDKRQKYEVVGTTGKVLFRSGSKATAQAVSRRYPGSTVEEKDKETVTADGSQ
ncbi:hypothetical protein [Streptomyces sp. NPDC053560]|uniref:hypothetical protein n=1 Tax=Streptomyces sp. NPDC053560 TaxID=3365711 RepID=UPI0037D79BA4